LEGVKLKHSLYEYFRSKYPNSDSNIDTQSLAKYYDIPVSKVRKILKDNDIKKESHNNTRYFWLPTEFERKTIEEIDKIFQKNLE
jgi:Ca2+-binding EF-hand superfamily protein